MTPPLSQKCKLWWKTNTYAATLSAKVLWRQKSALPYEMAGLIPQQARNLVQYLLMRPSQTIFPPKEQTMTKKQAPVSNAGAGSEGKRRGQVLTQASEDALPSLGKTQRVDSILETVYAFRAVTA